MFPRFRWPILDEMSAPDHDLAHVIAQPVTVPRTKVQQPLHALPGPHHRPSRPSLTAAHVADHHATGPATMGIDSRLLPLAGCVDAAVAAGFIPHPVTVAGATGMPNYGRIAVRENTAVVEISNSCGLTTLPGGRKAPLDASSLGLGQAIGHALRHDPNRLVLALSGSASNDGGVGMLAASGFTFHDADGRQLRACGRTLPLIHTIDSTRTVNLAGIEIIVAGDVTHPLVGPTGAAAVNGPQKGATRADVRFLDAGLDNLVEAFVRSGYPHARDIANAPGAGNTGGIGFAAMLLGAQMICGAEYFIDLAAFD